MANRPLIYDESTKTHVPLSDGGKLDPTSIPVSGMSGNLITTETDGLAVTTDGLVSDAAGNGLVTQDGRLYVETRVRVSGDDGNFLRSGTDGLVYVDGNDILSNGQPNLLTIDPTDKKIILTQESIAEYIDTVSEDAGNLIVAGSDGGAYLNGGRLVSSDSGNRLQLGGDGALFVKSPVSNDAHNIIEEGNDGMAWAPCDYGTME